MEHHKLASKEVTTSEEYHWADKIIMVAEDIEINFMFIQELLEPTGAIIIHAENGREALDYIRKETKIDIVLMDLLMPVMNGYEATRQIKSIRGNIPVIAQTAYSMSEDRKHAIEAGCDEYITKPIDRDELLSKINHFFLK